MFTGSAQTIAGRRRFRKGRGPGRVGRSVSLSVAVFGSRMSRVVSFLFCFHRRFVTSEGVLRDYVAQYLSFFLIGR